MNKIKRISFVVLVFILVSCNQNSKPFDNTEISTTNPVSNNNDDFEHFQSNFEPLSFDDFKNLEIKFNSHFLANDDSLIKVPSTYKSFLKNLNTERLYYGFKTKLPNKSVMLTFLIHNDAETNNESVIDTTFFISNVYSESGEFRSSFRTFGSNLAGEPPTYNMRSSFENDGNKLIITNYEYSTGKNYSEAQLLPGTDSIYLADLTKTTYYLNYTNNKVVLVNKSKSKTKVIESYHNPLPVYFKPLDSN